MKKNILPISFSIFSLLLLIKGIFWLAIPIFLLAVFFFFPKRFKFLKKYKWLTVVSTFVLVFMLAICLRIFLLEVYSIPSGSMEDTLIPGDKILVNKLTYGPELPRSPFEIPWINLFFYLNKNTREKKDSLAWDYKRLKGFTSPKRNNVMVFRHPIWGSRSNYMVKRCVALPGDTVKIERDILKVNNKILPESENLRRSYKLWTDNSKKFNSIVDSLKIVSGYNSIRSISETNLELTLNNYQLDLLLNLGVIDSFSVNITSRDSLQWIYPDDKELSWTVNDYGPLVVPQKGMTIQFDRNNFLIYQQTINLLEKIKLEEIDGEYFLNGVKATDFTFKNDYIFFMGDNRGYSIDSRQWGFVPEENIVGKASLILFSNNYEGFNFRRIFKVIK